MPKSVLLVLFSLAATLSAVGSPLSFSVSGQFAATDTMTKYVTPGANFKLLFTVNSNPTPSAVTTVGFDAAPLGSLFLINGNAVNVTPTEVRFNTGANGGLFDVSFGPNFSGAEFDFQGAQAFTGTTASPAFSAGSYSLSSFTISDPQNYDFQTPSVASVGVSATPEPSALPLLLCGVGLLAACKASAFGRRVLPVIAVALAASAVSQAEVPIAQVMNIPNLGQQITPLAPRGARFTYLNPGLAAYPDHNVGQAVSAVSSPDHKTLLVLTSGDYGIFTPAGAADRTASTDWVFVFDTTGPVPVQRQAIQVRNTYNGIAFDPSGLAFYVAGGRDDNMHSFALSNGVWAEQAGSPLALGHTSQAGGTSPEAAGLALSIDGTKMVITNYENDSVTLLNKVNDVWTKSGDLDLRPGKIDATQTGVPGGAYPFWVSIQANTTAYVSSLRDREIDVLNISGTTPILTTRIKLKGQPMKSVLNKAQSTLYVAEDQSDSVAMIDTASNTVMTEVKVVAPVGVVPASLAKLSGANTNSVTLSPDEGTLYVTNGNTNSVAVVSVNELGQNGVNPVLGLIPTAMYPTAVTLNSTGQFMYVINAKSPAGPNASHCHGNGIIVPSLTSAACNASNSYTLQLTKAGLQFIPVPPVSQLAALTNQVAINNGFANTETPATAATMDFLAQKIKHVIYIIKENRTYDQVLGDLAYANGDSALTEYPASVTPNLHNIAQNFVTLDNFYDASEVSYDGWAWSTGIVAPDIVLRHTPVNYSFRGGVSYDSEGDNRNINMVARTGTNATDPNVLPGLTDVAAPDGPNNQINSGYIWSAALRAGLTVRNYGFFVDNIGTAVSYPANETTQQVRPSNPDLNALTDIYFRGYDQNNADYYLYQEWAHDFDANPANFASLNLMRLAHDHTGNFSTALNGVNTPELEVADNDYAVGLVVDKIAHSQYANNTLIFVIEDDAQNGGDHVDAHRSIAFIAGPYVKHSGLVSTQYNTINFLRTMERVLGLAPQHLDDASAQPMADVFDTTQASWTYTAAPSAMLYNTTLPLPTKAAGLAVPKPTHNAAYWARVTKGMDFSKEDRVNPELFNRIVWQGLKGDKLYPGDPSLAITRQHYKEALRKRKVEVADNDGE